MVPGVFELSSLAVLGCVSTLGLLNTSLGTSDNVDTKSKQINLNVAAKSRMDVWTPTDMCMIEFCKVVFEHFGGVESSRIHMTFSPSHAKFDRALGVQGQAHMGPGWTQTMIVCLDVWYSFVFCLILKWFDFDF